MYLGGPLTFSTVLRKSFDETLHVTGTCPENSLLYVALGAAFYADQEFDLNEVASRWMNTAPPQLTSACRPCSRISRNMRTSMPAT